jgi:hypothetical protein
LSEVGYLVIAFLLGALLAYLRTKPPRQTLWIKDSQGIVLSQVDITYAPNITLTMPDVVETWSGPIEAHYPVNVHLEASE